MVDSVVRRCRCTAGFCDVNPPAWLAWTSYAHPKGYGHPAWGLFVYDPKVIRQRDDDRPPDDAATE